MNFSEVVDVLDLGLCLGSGGSQLSISILSTTDKNSLEQLKKALVVSTEEKKGVPTGGSTCLQPGDFPKSAETLVDRASHGPGKSGKILRGALRLFRKRFLQQVLDSHSLLNFSEQQQQVDKTSIAREPYLAQSNAR